MPKQKNNIPNRLPEILGRWQIKKSDILRYTALAPRTLNLLIKQQTSPDLATAFKITAAINYILWQRGIYTFYLPTDIWVFNYLPHSNIVSDISPIVKSDITEKLTKGESC